MITLRHTFHPSGVRERAEIGPTSITREFTGPSGPVLNRLLACCPDATLLSVEPQTGDGCCVRVLHTRVSA